MASRDQISVFFFQAEDGIRDLSVTGVQTCALPISDKNFAHAIDFVRDAAKQGAQIVCLPELFRSHYFCQAEDHTNFALAEEIPGRSTSTLGELARELDVVIIAS